MKTRYARVFAALSVTMILASEALAFYNPQSGKWLSRDPTEEAGGLNLNGFVNNQAISSSDYLGTATMVDAATRTITLGRCEIVIVYGHGSGLKASHWKWKYRAAACRAGAAVMCYPDTNTDGLEENMKLWLYWGGDDSSPNGREKVSEANWEKVVWGMSPTGKDFHKFLRLPNANKVLAKVGVDAIARANEFCKSQECRCKCVNITYIQVDKHGDPIQPKKAYDGMPAISDVSITCAAGGKP
jgi:hypothetical protein